MNHRFSYLISPDEDLCTIEELLRSRGYSRQLVIHLKARPEYITVSGQPAFVTRPLHTGECLQICLPEDEPQETIEPIFMPLDIVYEDAHILVINKPANTPVHPSQGNHLNTLANGLAWYFRQKGEPFVFRIINRLDRDTTGLLILARHALSACILSEMVRRREIHRTYLAAVSGDVRTMEPSAYPPGVLTPYVPQDPLLASGQEVSQRPAFTVTAPIRRAEGSTIERKVDVSDGRFARTHLTFLEYIPETDASFLQLQLDTGRTHQIRVHLKYLGFPIFGDFLYHPDFRLIGRQSLHSWKLSFLHPITKEPLAFTAAVPEDMRVFYGSRSPLG